MMRLTRSGEPRTAPRARRPGARCDDIVARLDAPPRHTLLARVRIGAVTLLAACIGHGSDIQAASADVDFLTAVGSALEKQCRTALSREDRLVNAEALLQLALAADQTASAPVRIPLRLYARACESYGKVVGGVAEGDLNAFLASSNVLSRSITLLEHATRKLSQTANLPGVVRNVAPPEAPGVVRVPGMGPEIISDPVVRAEYERRIRENSEKAQALSARHHLQMVLIDLYGPLKGLQEKAAIIHNTPALKIITQAFTESRLDEATKADLLGKPVAQ